MKKALSLLMVTAMVFALLSGCDKTPSGTTDPSNPNTQQKIRTDIIVGNTADISSTDPHDQTDVYSAAICDMIYSKLFYFDNEANLLPGLAKKWEILSDTEYKLYLEEGVKFHNGDVLTAEDVAFSIQRMIDMPKTSALYSLINNITIVDDHTITFTTSEPIASILLNLAGPQACIVNKKLVTETESAGKKYGDVTPIGTGSMKHGSYASNDNYKVVRFDDYYKGAVKATSITTRVIPEPSALSIALENGELDFVSSVPAIDIDKVKANPKLKTDEIIGGSISYMGINVSKAPFDNVDVRRAIASAINKQNIIDVVLEGYGIEVNSVFQVMMPSHDETLNPYPYNVEKAKEYMATAGYPNGGLNFEISVSSNSSDRVAQLIQADLEVIGITVDIRMQEFGALLQYLNGTDHNAFILGWSNCYNPDRTASLMFHSTSSASSGNRCLYKNPEADKLIDGARRELDWNKREPMYKEFQKIVAEDVAWVPLYQTKQIIGMAKGYEGGIISELTPFHDHTNAYVVIE